MPQTVRLHLIPSKLIPIQKQRGMRPVWVLLFLPRKVHYRVATAVVVKLYQNVILIHASTDYVNR